MKGFTLIELIVVIILMSILSALSIGLLSGTDNFSTRIISDQWLTSLRLSQRLSLLKQNPTQLLSLNITQNSNAWLLDIRQAGSSLNQFEVDKKQISIHQSISDFASACSALPQASFPLRFYFNGYGNHVNASRIQLSSNQRLCFSGSQTVELCLSPSGYAYVGSCEP